MTVLLDIVERFGLPIGILAVMLWALYRFAGWLGPILERVVEKHDTLVDTLREELQTQTSVLEHVQEVQAQGILKLDLLLDRTEPPAANRAG